MRTFSKIISQQRAFPRAGSRPSPDGTFVEVIAVAQVARRQPTLKIGKLGHFTKSRVCRSSSHSRTLPSSSLPRISSATDDRARETLNRFSRSKARARCCRIIIHRRRSATASVTDATGTIASAGCSTWKLDGTGIVIVAPCGSGQHRSRLLRADQAACSARLLASLWPNALSASSVAVSSLRVSRNSGRASFMPSCSAQAMSVP